MKQNYIVKSLTSLSFVIFFLPFLQMCASNTKTEGKPNQTITVEKTESVEIEIADTAMHPMFKKSDFIVNAYQLGFKSLTTLNKDELKETGIYGSFCYTIIILLSAVMVFFAFKINYQLVGYFALANLFLIIISTVIFYQSAALESFEQLKYGFYLFVLNTVLIWGFSHHAVKGKPKRSAA